MAALGDNEAERIERFVTITETPCDCRRLTPSRAGFVAQLPLRLTAPTPKPRYPKQFKHLGDHLRARRIDLGLLQRDVADQIGADTATVTNWELGNTEPEERFIPALIRFLGYNPLHQAEARGEEVRRTRFTRASQSKPSLASLAWMSSECQSPGEGQSTGLPGRRDKGLEGTGHVTPPRQPYAGRPSPFAIGVYTRKVGVRPLPVPLARVHQGLVDRKRPVSPPSSGSGRGGYACGKWKSVPPRPVRSRWLRLCLGEVGRGAVTASAVDSPPIHELDRSA